MDNNKIMLNEKQIKILKDAIYNNLQGMCNYVDYEVTDHISWKHSVNPARNIDFYEIKIHYQDDMSDEATNKYIKVFVKSFDDKFIIMKNLTASTCLQDFLIENFLQ